MTRCICNDQKLVSQDPEKFTKELSKLKIDPNDWSILYKCSECGSYWEKYYPYGERHGGGPAAVRKMTLLNAKEKYAINA